MIAKKSSPRPRRRGEEGTKIVFKKLSVFEPFFPMS